MNLEVAKEMDRKCVLNWLTEVYITPSLSYSEYTDEEIRTFAHDAIVLLKEQEAVEPKVMEPFRINSSGRMSRRKAWCGACGIGINMDSKFCDHCGRKVKWK